MDETVLLGKIISGETGINEFYKIFDGKYSDGFDPEVHLNRIGVVNQTTMLATETMAISEYLKNIMINKFGLQKINEHIADTKDTLCYATHDNQKATYGLLEQNADLAIVVGGYNSSNTSHLAELCEEKLPTYFISSSDKILSSKLISHFNYHDQSERVTENYLPEKEVIKIILTSGASCPDSIVDDVLQKILSYFETSKDIESVLLDID